jgi:glutaredoxin-related protein
MRILFYSNKCPHCNKLLENIKEFELEDYIEKICVDNNDKIPKNIKSVPTIIDDKYKDLLENNKAFEYVFNLRFFNQKTNNINFWKNKDLPNPNIKEDDYAFDEAQKNVDFIDPLSKDKITDYKPDKPKKLISKNRKMLLVAKR